jgi:hypothetical protein
MESTCRERRTDAGVTTSVQRRTRCHTPAGRRRATAGERIDVVSDRVSGEEAARASVCQLAGTTFITYCPVTFPPDEKFATM